MVIALSRLLTELSLLRQLFGIDSEAGSYRIRATCVFVMENVFDAREHDFYATYIVSSVQLYVKSQKI